MSQIDDRPTVGRCGVKVQADFTKKFQNGVEVVVVIIMVFQC